MPGGFDCSGFVWRVFKLQAYAGGESLADTLQGRTAAAMGGEVARAKRIPFAKLAAGRHHVLPASGSLTKAASVDHAGIYLGNGWMIHSSRYGVALAPVTSGWYAIGSPGAGGRSPKPVFPEAGADSAHPRHPRGTDPA